MKFLSARQAIHDAYAIHMRSKGLEVNLAEPVSELNVAGELARIQRQVDRLLQMDSRTDHQERRLLSLQQQIKQYAPVTFRHSDRSSRMDVDQLIWDSKDAAKVIAVVEKYPPHLKAWCYWCYSPLGDSNQSWFKRIEVKEKAREYRQEADRLAGIAADLPEIIARCKTTRWRKELEEMDAGQLFSQAANLEALANRLERSLIQPDNCSALWNWLDKQIAEQASAKIREKTLHHIQDVCRASLYNYRYQVVTGLHKALMSRKVLCDKFAVPDSHFERDYRPWVKWSYDVCDQLDRDSLRNVARFAIGIELSA